MQLINGRFLTNKTQSLIVYKAEKHKQGKYLIHVYNDFIPRTFAILFSDTHSNENKRNL